ncbi:hypothetical protein Bbelb_290500 [Branchiostoma belcheri]|nr:hypothetical protein Bbelb_290500 [Branchiostoma belcheri]
MLRRALNVVRENHGRNSDSIIKYSSGIRGFLPARLRHDLIWNRTGNIKGGPDRDVGLDLINEFLNNDFKGSKSAVDKVMKEMSAALTKSFKKDTPKKRQRKPSAVRFISGPNQLVICPYYDHRLIQLPAPSALPSQNSSVRLDERTKVKLGRALADSDSPLFVDALGDQGRKRKERGKFQKRVLLGDMFVEWRDLKSALNLKTDCDLARLLINSYRQHEDTPRPSSPQSPPSKSNTPSPPKTVTPSHASSPHVTQQPPNLNAGDISSISPGSSSTVSVVGEYRWLSSDDHHHSDHNQDMDDCELNALENSRISVEFYDEDLEEWISEDEAEIDEPEELMDGEDEEWSGEEGDLDSDPEYVPPVRMRSSCSKLAKDMRSLPIITHEEEVYAHDQSVAEGDDEDYVFFSPEELQIKEEQDIVGLQCGIVYTKCLLVLLRYMQLPYDKCKEKKCRAQVKKEPEAKLVGSGIILKWTCVDDHLQWKWGSQPRFKFNLQGGDFMLASSLLLSGNNYSKVNLMFKFMNMGFVCPTTFNSIQGQYCVPAIKQYWNDEKTRALRELRNKENVILLGDGRMDSPGHCAQYCTYTTMDHDTKKIVSVIVVDKRETERKSAQTEKAAF